MRKCRTKEKEGGAYMPCLFKYMGNSYWGIDFYSQRGELWKFWDLELLY